MIKGIYSEKDEKDPDYFIHFLENEDGSISARLVDSKGDAYYRDNHLFLIGKNTGTITLYPNINPVFGFDLDKCGKLKVK